MLVIHNQMMVMAFVRVKMAKMAKVAKVVKVVKVVKAEKAARPAALFRQSPPTVPMWPCCR